MEQITHEQMNGLIDRVMESQRGAVIHFERVRETISPTAAFYAGFNSEPMYSDEEIEALTLAMEIAEMPDGYLDCEPLAAPDSWPVLTSQELAYEYGSGAEGQ